MTWYAATIRPQSGDTVAFETPEGIAAGQYMSGIYDEDGGMRCPCGHEYPWSGVTRWAYIGEPG